LQVRVNIYVKRCLVFNLSVRPLLKNSLENVQIYDGFLSNFRPLLPI